MHIRSIHALISTSSCSASKHLKFNGDPRRFKIRMHVEYISSYGNQADDEP
ncbi:hypothetical protein L211DRAFT_552436 [Terfezia boudieri ATCC MYA-4762]|uniref:Uncharacterized protein n=1 Tax=Terfezia boudieri ATCC MYA-4762 TaxID=1051890 RepID=A0A3N4M3J8_9PEZI|nr:hypothetical protein L211DRAFT_552436 [Terfezia boudieri ATCC MYA-4762]